MVTIVVGSVAPSQGNVKTKVVKANTELSTVKADVVFINDFSDLKFTPVVVKVSAVKAKAVIGDYSWTSDCKCTQVGPGFAQYVAISYCKGLPKPTNCK